MPLPNAKPEPAGSNVYRQLNSIKLGDLTNEQFDKVYQNVFLNDMSEDELRRLALVGAARQSFSPSSSGHIPATSKFEFVTQSTTGVSANFSLPAAGTVDQVAALSYLVTGGSGNISYQVTVRSASGGSSIIVAEKAASDAADNFGDIDFTPLTLDENVQLSVTAYGTFTSIQYGLYSFQVR